MKKKVSTNSQEYKSYGLTTISLLFAVFITLRVLDMVQNNHLDSIGFYPALVIILSTLALVAGKSKLDIIILNTIAITVTLTTTIFWLYGVTAAGSWL